MSRQRKDLYDVYENHTRIIITRRLCSYCRSLPRSPLFLKGVYPTLCFVFPAPPSAPFPCVFKPLVPCHWQRALQVPNAWVPLIVQWVIRHLIDLEIVPAISESPMGQHVHLELLAAFLVNIQKSAVVTVIPPSAVDPSIHLELRQSTVLRTEQSNRAIERVSVVGVRWR